MYVPGFEGSRGRVAFYQEALSSEKMSSTIHWILVVVEDSFCYFFSSAEFPWAHPRHGSTLLYYKACPLYRAFIRCP